MSRPIRLRGAAMVAACAVACGLPTLAFSQELPRVDPQAIITIQDENASITSAKISDRYYVNGLRLSYVSPTGDLPSFAQRIGRTLWGDGRQRIAFDISQSIFTPLDTTSGRPARDDRPFAGTLLAGMSLIQDTADWRSILGVQVGLVGPWAGAEQVQNGFHDIIGQGSTRGWGNYHIHNEPLVQLLSERIWRLPIARFGGLETDALPNLTVGLGNERIYAMTGAVFRLGQGLDSDYGVSRVAPGMSGGDAFTPTRPIAWYIFAGADGQAIARDITLDGNSFERSPSVPLKALVAEFEAGVAVMAYGVRISYTHVLQTQEFRYQKGGLHQFGSLAGAVRF